MSRWHNVRRKLDRWLALERWEKYYFFKVSLLLPICWLALRVIRFNRLVDFATRGAPTPVRCDCSVISYANRCAELTQAAAIRVLPHGSCLPQALVLGWLLRQDKGLCVAIKIGTRASDDGIQAHAWVELDGQELGRSGHGFNSAFEFGH